MGLKEFLQGRKDASELGQGVWRRAHDRVRRGLDRFHQILERVPEGPALEALIPAANRLADLLPEVREIAVAAQRLAPSDSTDVPASRDGRYADLHRALSRSGNSLAQCAEALAMLRCSGNCQLEHCDQITAVERRVMAVEEQVAEAARYLRLADQAPALT